MSSFVELAAAGSPEANALLTAMLRALQDALRRSLVAPPGPPDAAIAAALEADLARALAAYDAFTAHVVAAHPMSCRTGCTACCHDNPRGVSGIELWRLGRAIDALPDGDAVRARFAELASLAAKEGADPDAWRRRRVPCPLLDTDGTCRAYAARPLACRAFWALTPASSCDPGDPGYASRVNPHLDPPAVLLQLLQAISQRMGLPASADLHGGIAAAASASAVGPISPGSGAP